MSNQEFPPKSSDQADVLENKVSNVETPEVSNLQQKLADEAKNQQEKLETLEQRKEKDKLKERAISEKIGFIFKSKGEKENYAKQESFVNEYIDKNIIKSKAEKDFLLNQSMNFVRFVNSGKMELPTDEEMTSMLRDAGLDKFRGIISYKDGKIQYRKAKDVNWSGASGSAVS